jgi:hypothetical protein
MIVLRGRIRLGHAALLSPLAASVKPASRKARRLPPEQKQKANGCPFGFCKNLKRYLIYFRPLVLLRQLKMGSFGKIF